MRGQFVSLLGCFVRFRGLKRPIHPVQIIGARASGGAGGLFNCLRNEKERKEQREKRKEIKKIKKVKESFGPNVNQVP